MENIFTISKHDDQYDDNAASSINIDDLYEKKRERDMAQLRIFNKMPRRIHGKIQLTTRQKVAEKICWFVVPEIMLGVPVYEQGGCIAYVMDKLKSDGFAVQYVHPNTLFICWNHWVPNYVISEIKTKTGVVYDNYGNTVAPTPAPQEMISLQTDPYDTSSTTTKTATLSLNTKQGVFQKKRDNTVFRSTDTYKPSGSMVYDEQLLFNLSKKK